MTLGAKDLWVREQMEAFVIPNCIDPAEAQVAFEFFSGSSFADQRVRYLLTYDILKRKLDLNGCDIAETGHLSGLSNWLRRTGSEVKELEGDFRYNIHADDKSADIVLCLEVIEHIKDQDARFFDDLVLFNYSGVRAFASELSRIVRPGGRLVVSTPNPCSLYCLEQIHGMKTPWLFPQHVREYAPEEIIDLLHEFNFECEYQTTMYTAHYFDAVDRNIRLKKHFPDEENRQELRGDDALYIFRRC